MFTSFSVGLAVSAVPGKVLLPTVGTFSLTTIFLAVSGVVSFCTLSTSYIPSAGRLSVTLSLTLKALWDLEPLVIDLGGVFPSVDY